MHAPIDSHTHERARTCHTRAPGNPQETIRATCCRANLCTHPTPPRLPTHPLMRTKPHAGSCGWRRVISVISCNVRAIITPNPLLTHFPRDHRETLRLAALRQKKEEAAKAAQEEASKEGGDNKMDEGK